MRANGRGTRTKTRSKQKNRRKDTRTDDFKKQKFGDAPIPTD